MAMVFYKKITICNVFAYKNVQNIEFDELANKNLYLIYGNNGYGKTSFIRALKILFLGSGLNDFSKTIPESIKNFVSSISPRQLILGDNKNWLGILNKNAVDEKLSEYYIELSLAKNKKDITIKRSWQIEPLKENLTYKIDGLVFTDIEAQEKIDQILPSMFVEFFMFDGEEIEKMAEKISSSLKDKIQNILNITPINNLIREAKRVKDEYFDKNINNLEDQNALKVLRADKEKLIDDQVLNQMRLNQIESNIKDLLQNISQKNSTRDSYIKTSGEEEAKLLAKKENALMGIEKSKESLAENLPEILFLGLDEFFIELKKYFSEILNNQSVKDTNQLRRIKNPLSENLADKISEKYDGINKYELRDEILNIINEIVDENCDYGPFSGLLDSEILKTIEYSRQNITNLSNLIMDIKANFKNLEDAEFGLEDILTDSDIKNDIKALEKELKTLNDEYRNLKTDQEKLISSQKDLIIAKEKTDEEIQNLENSVAKNLRLEKQIEITDEIIKGLEKYKTECISKLLRDLKGKVLKNYKKLIDNDNVESIDISSDFELSLKDKNNQPIAIKNQSAGQKQVTAISIFWALSELSERVLPLIIDTPLSRMDSVNTKNIIENYYLNASNQVIILPHSAREFGTKEYKISKENVAQSFVIENDNTRRHAKFSNKDIIEILGEDYGE